MLKQFSLMITLEFWQAYPYDNLRENSHQWKMDMGREQQQAHVIIP